MADQKHTTEYRVIGPPGTGKTTYLSRQVEAAVDQGLRVAVASLTRTAAAEVAGRGLPVPDSAIGTLHSHAYQALGHQAIADVPKQLKAWNEENPDLVVSGGRDLDDDNLDASPAGAPGDDAYNRMNLLRGRLFPQRLWSPNVLHFAHRWQAWKEGNGLLDFTDLIEQALDCVPQAPDLPDTLFLDEAQDMSRLEMALARKWGSAAGRFVIAGDPDQCLYRWRGADPSIFHDSAVPNSHTRVLDQSWRVPQAIHTRALAWIGQCPDRRHVEYRPTEQPGSVMSVGGSWKWPEGLLRDLETDLSLDRTVMILATCSYMLRPLIACLRQHGVPFHNPYRHKNGAWNPLRGSARGTTAAQRLLAFLEWTRTDRWDTSTVKAWTGALKARNVMPRGGKKRLGSIGDARLTEGEIAEILTPESMQAVWNRDVEWFRDNLTARLSKTMSFPLAICRRSGEQGLRAGSRSNGPKLTIGTVHSVKGGEVDAVYLFPDLSPRGMEEWVGGPAQRASVYRLFYVGMTRARQALKLCSPASQRTVMWR